jgi:beta-phosphoglucomutase-like phosphatase (HAD superfamily)
MTRNKTAFLFDLDGTLIDSVYQHVLAWKSSLDQEGIPLSVWRIHRKIGMSGGLFANILLRETGFDNTPERLERLRVRHADRRAARAWAGRRFAVRRVRRRGVGARRSVSGL